ncbi:helix-turn-helix domain-containing protein [Streptomyces sp. ID05-39B]|uniref:helix-turn-helix domain-containing protein n=1 Tax=Streptomyces sp. ID05-39B TaxID=3028664 RepID=UPI0029A96E40|nr:helix-turn-helix domain-containing protein [Streptomyces sp. ID05-39B]MDX3531948.1 helix-turn-helix domain-containing protein [Streptomyces sp. ID05-39B]
MIAAAQWLHATTGRIATCPHSWMQAVHWVYGSGLYTPQRATGPRAMNTTTLAVAQEIAALSECRPSVDYLARKLKASARTIKYHLGMLREAGLLVYRSKGTRISGIGGRASVFERTIPAAFDTALGIRTTGEGATRRPVGIAEQGRTLIGKLAKKAARKTRRRPSRTRSQRNKRCTPMQGGTSTVSSTALTHLPSEAKLASGNGESQPKKESKRGQRTLNKVGRRYQLARELKQTVPWLNRASVPRLAWIVRHVADAGWTMFEVQAAAELLPVAADDARRPSGLLAYRLASCHLLYNTPAKRQILVEDWRESRSAEEARHTGYDDLGTGPRSPAARRAMDEAFAVIQARLAPTVATDDQDDLALEDLSKAEVAAMRDEARRDPGLILSALELMGERETRRLYTHRLVDQTLALEAINARRDTLAPAF